MKHEIIKPNGETYASVWADAGRLNIQLWGWGALLDGQHPIIIMDLKVISQLVAALQAIQKEAE